MCIVKITVESGSGDPLLISERRLSVANRKSVTEVVRTLISPVADSMGFTLWDVEFVREGARRILRITLDKPEGINIDDCETFHRTIDPMLDEADPIDVSYYLEVSSPGAERELKYDFHFEACMGERVEVRLFAPDERGQRSVVGCLEGYDADSITVGGRRIARTAIAKAHTVFDFGD